MEKSWKVAILIVAWAIILMGCSLSVGLSSTPTPTPLAACVEAEKTPEPSNESGLIVYGCVRGRDGAGLAGVKILRAYASYSGEVIATTGLDGSYRSKFYPIPGDEMVRVGAEKEGVTFEPGSKVDWRDGVYYWRHYYGYEASRLDFVAR